LKKIDEENEKNRPDWIRGFLTYPRENSKALILFYHTYQEKGFVEQSDLAGKVFRKAIEATSFLQGMRQYKLIRKVEKEEKKELKTKPTPYARIFVPIIKENGEMELEIYLKELLDESSELSKKIRY